MGDEQDIRRDDGLTDAEGVVSDALVSAVEAWARLPRQHPQEINEFLTAIHALQGLLTTRIARRHYPKGWPTYPSTPPPHPGPPPENLAAHEKRPR